jgi:hypothetical protein
LQICSTTTIFKMNKMDGMKASNQLWCKRLIVKYLVIQSLNQMLPLEDTKGLIWLLFLVNRCLLSLWKATSVTCWPFDNVLVQCRDEAVMLRWRRWLSKSPLPRFYRATMILGRHVITRRNSRSNVWSQSRHCQQNLFGAQGHFQFIVAECFSRCGSMTNVLDRRIGIIHSFFIQVIGDDNFGSRSRRSFCILIISINQSVNHIFPRCDRTVRLRPTVYVSLRACR